jgi:hypothetical protein
MRDTRLLDEFVLQTLRGAWIRKRCCGEHPRRAIGPAKRIFEIVFRMSNLLAEIRQCEMSRVRNSLPVISMALLCFSKWNFERAFRSEGIRRLSGFAARIWD